MNKGSCASRFNEMLIEDSNGCLNWTGYTIKSNGRDSHCYGRLRVNGIKTLAHRYAYFKEYGDIPDGLQVLHRCDNTVCCNPEHLFLGTHQDNMKDRDEKGRGLKGKKGHGNYLLGEKSLHSKLTNRMIQEAKILHFFTGISQSQIARKYNVHPSVLHRAIHGKTWSHII